MVRTSKRSAACNDVKRCGPSVPAMNTVQAVKAAPGGMGGGIGVPSATITGGMGGGIGVPSATITGGMGGGIGVPSATITGGMGGGIGVPSATKTGVMGGGGGNRLPSATLTFLL